MTAISLAYRWLSATGAIPLQACGVLEDSVAGPFSVDLRADVTKQSTHGGFFVFILGGCRQGLAAMLRDRESASPMPSSGPLLMEEER